MHRDPSGCLGYMRLDTHLIHLVSGVMTPRSTISCNVASIFPLDSMGILQQACCTLKVHSDDVVACHVPNSGKGVCEGLHDG